MVNESYQQQKQARLTYSKKQVRKAGDAIRKGCTEEQKTQAIKVIRNFRESHLYPLMLIKNHVNRMAKKVSEDYILARRLKRLPTILDKLTRPTLDGQQANAISITRMQDIGGCRIIFDTVDEVYQCLEYLKKSRSVHKIIKIQDTMFELKQSGYRGVHVVFSCYENSNDDSNPWFKHKIELQLRTRLQHAWATCIETIDIFEQTQLKTRLDGSNEFREFFKLAAQLMAHQENDNYMLGDEYSLALMKFITLEKQLGIVNKLYSYFLASKNMGYQGTGKNLQGQILIAIGRNKDQQLTNSVRYFAKNKNEEAVKEYGRLEDDPLLDVVVLVSVKNLVDLKKAFPNYYADTELFIGFVVKQQSELIERLTIQVNKIKANETKQSNQVSPSD